MWEKIIWVWIPKVVFLLEKSLKYEEKISTK